MESLQQQPGQEAVSPDQLVVMQLLEEIRRLILVPGGVNLPGVVNPRRLAAAKLYLDTRDAFEVVEKQVEEDMHDKPKLLRKLSKGSRGKSIASSATPTNSPRTSVSPRPLVSDENPLNDQVTDRIQDMFRDLGELLGVAILKELQQRKLTLQSILHYVRFLPAEYQWAAYRDARRDEVAAAYRVPTSPRGGSAVMNGVEAPAAAAANNAIGVSSSSTQALKRHSEFVKQQIRKDVDTVCLFAADGTLSTIFGDEVATVEENVADKFVTLLTDIYSQYLLPPLEAQVENLIQYSDQWSREVTEASATSVMESLQPLATYYARPRRFRTKVNIFPDHLFGIDDRYTSLLLPPVPPGQHVKLLVADTSRVGVWWQKSVFSNTDRAVSTLHNDEMRKISSQVESLDGQIYSSLFGSTDLSSQMESSRRFGKSGWMAKWVGQRVLVNNGRDSLWVEVTITDFDDRKCKLKLKKSLEHYPLIETWTHFLMLNDWVNVRDLKFIGVPVCPDFRTFMGLRFRETLEVMHEVAVEISSIFPNDELAQKIGNSLWGLVERSISKGEHIFSRYFRSMLQHDDLYSERRTLGASLIPRRSSFGRSSGMRSMLDTTQASNGTGPSSAHLPVPAPGSPSRDEARKKGPTVGVFNANGRYVLQSVESLLSGSFSISPSQRYAVEPRISPFEKLSHHLLEETEVIGSCMQAHSVAISRAFVQVLVEKISKIRRSSNERLHGGALLSVERVLAEYANAYRLLHVWRICRYELDTIPRQRRLRVVDTNAIHYKWVDRTFERMETEILETIEALSHYIHRTFFHECISQVLPGVFEQVWTASRPWFGNSRCTYAIQGFIFRFQVLLEHVDNPILSRHERNLGIHEKLHKILATMFLDVFASVAEAYMVMDVSRARGVQWKMDVLYLVCGVHKLVRLLDRMVSSRTPELKKSTSAISRIRQLSLRMLEHLAVRFGPGDTILDLVKKKLESVPADSSDYDPTSELEFHASSVYSALDASSLLTPSVLFETSSDIMWQAHSLFQEIELRKLGEVQLDWSALISRSCLSQDDFIDLLRKRHELGDWAFPSLNEAEVQFKDRLLQFIDNVHDSTSNTGEQLTESDQVDASGAARKESTLPPLRVTHAIEEGASSIRSSGPPSMMVSELASLQAAAEDAQAKVVQAEIDRLTSEDYSPALS